MKIVDFVASVITEDPDILNEEALATAPGMASGTTPGGANKPMTATELNQEAEEITGNKDLSKQVGDQLKAQEEQEKAARLEQQRIVKPQLQRLDQSLTKLDSGIKQGTQNASQVGDQYNNLDSEMTTIKTLINSLGKNLN